MQKGDKIKTVEFVSRKPGLTLVVTGAIHGNEPCGPEAINRIIKEFKDKNITLERGRIIFAPVCNPRAYAEGKRYIDSNLNRSLMPQDDPKTYEDGLKNQLCPILSEADVLLDLHSYKSQGPACVFIGPPNANEVAYARALGPTRFIHGWQKVFNAAASNDPYAGVGTTDYVRRHGGIAVTMECGSHKDPQAPIEGMKAILNALRHFKMAKVDPRLVASLNIDAPRAPEECVEMHSVVIKRAEGHFTQKWNMYSAVSQGQPMAEYDDGGQELAPADGVILLPVEEEPVGEEWFFFGARSNVLKSFPPP